MNEIVSLKKLSLALIDISQKKLNAIEEALNEDELDLAEIHIIELEGISQYLALAPNSIQQEALLEFNKNLELAHKHYDAIV